MSQPSELASDGSERNDYTYDAFAILSYEGTFDSGQYVTFGKSVDGTWKRFEQSSVTAIDQNAIQMQDVVVIMYEKKSMK
jgi:ubiquitin C-terminal hydrolase